MRWRSRLLICVFAWSEASRSDQLLTADVHCEAGNCFYRKRQTSLIIPLDEGAVLKLVLGDVVIGVGSGTRIKVRYDDGSRAELKDSGLMKIVGGRKDANLTDGSEGLKPTPKPTPTGSNLVYIGSFPLRVLTPSLDEPLIFQSFPQTLRIVFEPMTQADLEKVKASYLKWFVGGSELIFEETALGSRQFAATIQVNAPGEIMLRPAPRSDDGIRIKVLGGDALEGQLQELLKNADGSPDAGIELRGK